MKPELHSLAGEFVQPAREHIALIRQLGRVQLRCSEQLCAQAREVERLRAQVMRLRAAVIVRETQLAWAREDHAAPEQGLPGLPRRLTLASRVAAWLAWMQDHLRKRSHGACHRARMAPPTGIEPVSSA